MYRGRQCSHPSFKSLATKGLPVTAGVQPNRRICPYVSRHTGMRLDHPIDSSLRKADIYIVSVKDAVLETVISQLTHCNPEALYLHTAGSMPMEIWKGKQKNYGVAYPMQTFSKQREVRMEDVPFFIEANTAENLLQLRKIAESLSSKVYEATSAQRKYLHIAAVFACNFSNHMYAICEHLLTAHQLPFETMLPLIDETARKVHELSPIEAQTGPARRYDENVIQRHLDMLKEEEPQLAEIYRLLSLHIHQYETEHQK